MQSVSGDVGAFCVSWNFSDLVGCLVGWFIGWLVYSATRHGLCSLLTHFAKVHRLLEVEMSHKPGW
jgi:hypothetical protein